MQVLRLATLAILALCAASGCRTAGVGDLARPDPPIAAGSEKISEILAEHNKNAERIKVLMAKPDMTVTVYEGPNQTQKSSHALAGKLLMEQPRNFKLELYSTSLKMGDIGSNETEYWFWVREKTQNSIYYCNYEEAEATRQAVTFQPDWIKEAMGLRVIPVAESSEMTLKAGDPGTLVLTHRPHKAGGVIYTRVTILDKSTHEIREHQLRSADQKTVLATAKIPEGYFPVTPDSGGGTESVLIPRRLQLKWVQEGLELDVTFRNVQVNKEVSDRQRAALFTEPKSRGYTRINLAERPPGTADAGQTTIRETRPAPPSGGIRLSEPTSLEGDEAARDRVRERDGGSRPLALNGSEPMAPSLTDAVIGPRFPVAPEPEAPRGENPGWRAATNNGFVP